MSEGNGPNFTVTAVLASATLGFLIYHTARFDRCRCLVPTRRHWFRWLLTWMLLISNICLLVWGIGWCYVKNTLGMVRLGPHAARPWPSQLFPPKFLGFDTPLTICLALCYSLQASLNLEEALFFAHLMRATKRPYLAKPFLRSAYFYVWAILSVLIIVIELALKWMVANVNLQKQMSEGFIVTACLELLVLIPATYIVSQFPRFMSDLTSAGAGPAVRVRLYYYHELNKIRNFCRWTFIIPILILGFDGLTPKSPISMTPLVTDGFAFITVASLCAVMVISIQLYLPREAASTYRNSAMVGPAGPVSVSQRGSVFAVLSLLRDGGQWDGRDGGGESRVEADDAPFAHAGVKGGGLIVDGEEAGWVRRQSSGSAGPIATFTSPIDIVTETRAKGPVEIRMVVEREVHKD